MSVLSEGDPFGRAASRWGGAGEELKQSAATGFMAVAAALLCLFTFALASAAPQHSLYTIRMLGVALLGVVAVGNAGLCCASGARAARAYWFGCQTETRPTFPKKPSL